MFFETKIVHISWKWQKTLCTDTMCCTVGKSSEHKWKKFCITKSIHRKRKCHDVAKEKKRKYPNKTTFVSDFSLHVFFTFRFKSSFLNFPFASFNSFSFHYLFVIVVGVHFAFISFSLSLSLHVCVMCVVYTFCLMAAYIFETPTQNRFRFNSIIHNFFAILLAAILVECTRAHKGKQCDEKDRWPNFRIEWQRQHYSVK